MGVGGVGITAATADEDHHHLDQQAIAAEKSSSGAGAGAAWDPDWDNRMEHQQAIKVENKNSGARYLVLVRHGQYQHDGDGDSSGKLTPLGREQAERTGKRLAELKIPFSQIHCSDFTRAAETCDIIADHLPE